MLGNCGVDSTQEMHPRMKGLAEKEKEAEEGGDSTKFPLRATNFSFPQPQQMKLTLTHDWVFFPNLNLITGEF